MSFRQANFVAPAYFLLIWTDLQHQVWLLTLNGRMHTSQLSGEIRSILDIGCGTGVWALAMAAQWPRAQVVALDITLPVITPPANLTLVQSDADKPWPFQDRKFSFIHGRMLSSGIHDWPGLLSRCWEHLEPAGRLELLDVCHPFRADDPAADNETSPFIKFCAEAEASWEAKGLDYRTTLKHEQRLHGLGFQHVRETRVQWPLGEWADNDTARRIGALTLQNFNTFIPTAGATILANHPSLTAQEAKKLCDEALADLLDNCMTKRFYLSL
jgi:SAM-dependent methyltransferase